MKDAAASLQELKDALETLSPHDFAQWSAWLETRLTERLRRRQSVRPAADAVNAPNEEQDSTHA